MRRELQLNHMAKILFLYINKVGQREFFLKDFHDGVRYSPAHLAHPELAPELDQLPPEHAKNQQYVIYFDR